MWVGHFIFHRFVVVLKLKIQGVESSVYQKGINPRVQVLGDKKVFFYICFRKSNKK